ncbi:MAG: TolC family protein, partial [Pirellulales bacterium]|nr:TolC family protein [Pirellulales bacterium]
VEEATPDEVKGSHAPRTLKDPQEQDTWDLSLEEAIRISLENGKVLRELGARLINDPLLDNPTAIGTVYDPSIIETGQGTSVAGTGVEAALAEFDARLESSLFWEKVDQPQNSDVTDIFPATRVEDVATFGLAIRKRTASGGEFSVTNATIYTDSNLPTRSTPQDYSLDFGLNFRQPLLQGRGVQFNRTVGPNSGHDAFFGFNGVAIARIRHDVSLADFENKVHNFVKSVEEAYWDLLFAYHDLESQKTGRESALATWKKVHAKFIAGLGGGDAAEEAQSREQFFLFQSRVEQALTTLYRAESELRFLMGLAQSGGRLIRPADEPTTAKVAFDWSDIMCESLVRSVPIRQRKWEIKRRELELAGAKNFLMPRLDVVGNYNFLGLGEKLVRRDRVSTTDSFAGTYAYQDLTTGDHQEFGVGLEFSMPIGFRRELSGVRHYELLLAKERALLQEQELSLSHELADALRELENQYALAETNFNRLVAAQRQVEAVGAKYRAGAGNVTLDLLLDAQRRRSEAETEYYRSIVEYNIAIALVHFRKGSLLEYNNVLLAEGPWPQKAYFDAKRQARKRDASMYLDYGFTRPKVFSRGPYAQHGGVEHLEGETIHEGVIEHGGGATDSYYDPDNAEELPAPVPTPDMSTGVLPEAQPATADIIFAAPGRESVPAGAPARLKAERAKEAAPLSTLESASKQSSNSKIQSVSFKTTSSKNGQNEPDANHSAAKIDQPSTGWSRAQR